MFNLFKKKAVVELIAEKPRKRPNWMGVINRIEAMQDMPTVVYEMPSLPAGVIPEGYEMAMDGFCTASNYTDLDAQYYSSFLNYNALMQLAQSSEYRLVAETFAQEMTREWGEVKGADEEKIKKIEQELKRLNVRAKLRKAIEIDFLFGGAQIYIDIEGQENNTDLPLLINEKGVKKGSFRGLVVREPIWSTPSEYNAHEPLLDTFFKPSKWFVLGKVVDQSRLMTLVMRPVNDILKPMYNFYGVSMTQLMLPSVQRYQSISDATAKVVTMFTLTGIKTDMAALLGGDEGGANEAVDRIKALSMLRDNTGVVAVNKESEEIFQINTPLTGLDVILDKFVQMLAYPSKIPVLKLFGTPTGGLGNTSDGEIRVFYDGISAQQEAFASPIMKTTLDLIQLSLFGEIDPEIEFKFNPLYQLDDNERADVNLKKAQIAQIYIQEGVIDNDEARDNLTEDEESGYQLTGNAPEKDPYSENENVDIVEK